MPILAKTDGEVREERETAERARALPRRIVGHEHRVLPRRGRGLRADVGDRHCRIRHYGSCGIGNRAGDDALHGL